MSDTCGGARCTADTCERYVPTELEEMRAACEELEAAFVELKAKLRENVDDEEVLP